MWLRRVLLRASGVAECTSDVPLAVLLPHWPMLRLGRAMGAVPYLAALLTWINMPSHIRCACAG